MKKFLAGVVIVFLAWYMFTQPVAMGHAVHNLGQILNHGAESVATMINHALG